jgi:ketosteroid isomerase-like protein
MGSEGMALGARSDVRFRRLLERFYEWNSGRRAARQCRPERTIAHSAAEYAAIWDTGLTNLTALSKTLDDRPHVVVAGDLAIVDICFISRFEFEDGNTDVAPTRRSLVLRRDGNRWLIFRQHGSALSPHT